MKTKVVWKKGEDEMLLLFHTVCYMNTECYSRDGSNENAKKNNHIFDNAVMDPGVLGVYNVHLFFITK